jgi:two-component system phosphate regulon response regulator OmpR
MLTALLGLDYDTESAGGIGEAIEIASRERFDLYILDNIFPDGTGLELCRQLRELYPQTPIIFYSGAVFESDREEGLRAGAQEYVAKPGVNGLSETVRRVLDHGA